MTRPSHALWFRVATLCAFSLVTGCADPDQSSFEMKLLESPAGPGSAEPNLSRGPNGTVVLSWLEPAAEGVALRHAQFENGQWKAAKTIASGDNWFVNWADFPSVTPVSDDLWAAHWLVRKPGGTYAYDVAMSLSQDSGQTWSDAIAPHTDNTPTEHGFVSVFPWRGGTGALWLDGRNMSGGGHGENHSSDSASGMTLRSAVLTPQGAVTQPQLVDDLVCDCCQTDVALGASGPIAVYRNRTEDEIRDIYLSRAVDGIWQDSSPVKRDGWKISGCPVNGPAIATHENNVAVAWFTAANNIPRVRLALSDNDAVTFSHVIDIDAESPLGRVDVELLKNGHAVVSWMRKTLNGDSELCLQVVSPTGHAGKTHVVTPISGERSSGFPQMIRVDDQLLLAWTDTSGDESVIQTLRVLARVPENE